MGQTFGHLRLDRATRQLIGPQGPVDLSARSFDILATLLARPDEVVGKAELFDAVWPGQVVEENTLQVHISALRKVLGDGMIMTVHGRGYKYAGPAPVPAAADTVAPAGRTGGMPSADAQPRPSIAVLPFDNMSGDPEQAYFSDGITEDIIAELGRFREFLVIARNSSFRFRGRAHDVAEVAGQLDVQYLVEGSVRKVANRVRVTVQLIDAPAATRVWAEHYDRELDDIFAIQDDITAMISARLARQARTASTARTKTRPTGNMSAYDCYLRALQLNGSYDTVLEAEPLLRTAIALDPGFAGAHAVLGFVESIKFYWDSGRDHLHSGLAMAKTALALDPEETYGHLAAGFALAYLRRFREAEASLDHAVALNPNDPLVRSIRAILRAYTGRPDQALADMQEAQRRDPFAVGWFEDFLGVILTTAGRYREAIDSYAKLPTVQPWSLVHLTICHAELGEAQQAQAVLARLRALWPGQSVERILDGEDVFEDPSVFERYRAIFRSLEPGA